MSRVILLARRTTAHRGLLALVWLLVAVLTGALGVTVGWTQAAATQSARAGLTAAEPSSRALQLATRVAEDPAEADAQDARVREVLAGLLPGVPYRVAADLRTEAQYVRAGDGHDLGRWTLALLPAASRADALAGGGAEGVTVVDGAWPVGADEAAVQADAAEAAGLAVGDTLRVGVDPDEPLSTGVTVTVTGTWRVADPDDAVWAGDPAALTGTDGTYPGPVVVSDEVVEGLPTDPFARWTVVPDVAALTPDHLPALAALAGEVERLLGEDAAVAPRGLTVTGTLDVTAAGLDDALRAADAVALVPLCLLALVGLVALVQVARLLAATREGEVALLVSRGAAPGTVTAAAAVEGALLAVTASAAGGAAAWAALRLVARTDPGAVPAMTPLAVSSGVAVAATAALVLVAALQAQAAVRRQVTDRSGRVRQAAALGTVVLTIAAAVLSAAQLLRYGSPLVTTPAGATTDPAAAAAPALVLAALAVVAMAVLGPATRVWASLAARSRGAVGPLAARQVARRLAVYVVPVVLLVLAGGAASLAGGFTGTAERLRADVDVLAVGADVRVGAPENGRLDAAPYLPGGSGPGGDAAASAPALSVTAHSDSIPVTLLALPATVLPQVVRAPDGALDLDTVAAELAVDAFAGAPALPDGARDVGLTVEGSIGTTDETEPWGAARPHELDLSLLLAAPDGTLAHVPLGELTEGDGTGDTLGPQRTTHELSGAVPAPPAGLTWHVAALDLATRPGWTPAEAELVLSGLSSGGAPVDAPAWTRSDTLDGAGGLELEADDPDGDVRLTMPLGGAATGASRLRLLSTPQAGPVPLLASESLATALDLAPGDTVELTLAGTRVPVVATGSAGTVPGALDPYAALVDRGALAAVLVRTVSEPVLTDEVWLAAGPPGAPPPATAVARLAAAAGAAAEQAGTGPRDRPEITIPQAASATTAVPVRVSFWLAAAGAAVLALAGVLAVAVAMLRERRGEVVVLRAVGLGPAAQGRARAAELVAVGLAALAVGAAAGWAVARFTAGGLAAATLTGVAAAPPARFVLETAGTGLVLAAAAAGLALVAAGVGGRVAAQVRDTTYREEVR